MTKKPLLNLTLSTMACSALIATVGMADYTNGPLVTDPGAGCDPFGGAPRDATAVQTALGNNFTGLAVGSNFPARITDDFPLCDDALVTAIEFHIWQSAIPNNNPGDNEITTISDMSLNIYDGRPGDLGTGAALVSIASAVADGNVTFTVTNASDPGNGLYKSVDTDVASCTRPVQKCTMTFAKPIALSAGCYWLDYDATGDGVNGGPWIPPIADQATATTGNARQFFGGSWSFLEGGDGSFGPGGRVGSPFIVFATGGECGAADEPCDFDNDGDVDVDDLLVVLGSYDIDADGDCTGDGLTNVDDLLAVLGLWGDLDGGGESPLAPNDELGGAISLDGYGIQGYDLGKATQSESAGCASGKDLFYTFTAPNTENVTARCSEGATIEISDGGGVIACGAGSASFAATGGASYTARIIETGANDGRFDELSFDLQAPNNDECEDSLPIGLGATAFDTTGSTPANGVEHGCDTSGSGTDISRDIWYDFTAPDTGFLSLGTCEEFGGFATFDSDLVFYAGSDCGTMELITCNDDADSPCGTAGGSDGDNNGWHSHIPSVAVISGQPYKVQLGGWSVSGDFGTGMLNIDLAVGPINSVCVGAEPIVIDGPAVTGDTTGADVDTISGITCEGILPDIGGAWYTFVGDGTTLTVSTCAAGTAFNTQINVYEGTCAAPVCVTANDDDPTCFIGFVGESTVQFCSTLGTTYYIYLNGNAAGVGGQGAYSMSVTSGASCP